MKERENINTKFVLVRTISQKTEIIDENDDGDVNIAD